MANTSSNPLDRDSDIAIGVTLPIRKTATGYFEQSYKTSDQVKSNLKNLLLTKKGERVMQPTFGSGLWELMFEPNTSELETSIHETIVDSVATWLPYVNIQEIILRRDSVNIDTYTIEIQIDFTISNDPTALETIILELAV